MVPGFLTSTEPQRIGLLPYLRQKLALQFDTFQVEGWGYSGVRTGTGYRIKAVESDDSIDYDSQEKITCLLSLAYLATLRAEEETQIFNMAFVVNLHKEIKLWCLKNNHNVLPLREGLLTAIRVVPDTHKSSGDVGAWFCISETSIKLSFYAAYS